MSIFKTLNELVVLLSIQDLLVVELVNTFEVMNLGIKWNGKQGRLLEITKHTGLFSFMIYASLSIL